MERSGRTAPAVFEHADLAELMREPGPFLTVWASRPGFNAKALASRAREVRDTVRNLVPEAVVDQVVAAIDAAFPAAAGIVAVADASRVRFIEELPEPPRADVTRLEALPSLAPVIEHRQASIPFVLVVTDRLGADIVWSSPENSGRHTVEGEEEPIRKVMPGGWSQRRFQQRAEDTWEHTASDVADTVQLVSRDVQPRVITLAGDVRMVELLRRRLPDDLVALLRPVPGGRSEDGSDASRERAIRRWIRTAIAEDTVAVLQLFEQERGQRHRAADGAGDTLRALAEARVEVLLVHDDPDSARPAFFVPEEPSAVAMERGTLVDLGHRRPQAGRVADVAIRAAVLTGAGIRIVPAAGTVTDGIGAILRW